MCAEDDPPAKQAPPRRTKRIAPSAVTAQELAALLQGHTAVARGAEWLRTVGPRAPERGLQEALDQEQTARLGRNRSERRGGTAGSRQGDAAGTLKTAAGVLRVQGPQRRGWEEAERSQVGDQRAQTRDRLTTLLGERLVGGMSPRALAPAVANAWGPCVLATSAMRTMTETRSQEAEAVRTRDLRGDDVASLWIDTVEAP